MSVRLNAIKINARREIYSNRKQIVKFLNSFIKYIQTFNLTILNKEQKINPIYCRVLSKVDGEAHNLEVVGSIPTPALNFATII